MKGRDQHLPTRDCRHRWSRKSPVKIEEITGALSQHCGCRGLPDESHSVG